MGNPSHAELIEQRREWVQERATMQARINDLLTAPDSSGNGSPSVDPRRAFVEAIVAAAVAQKGTGVLTRGNAGGEFVPPPALGAIRNAHKCVEFGMRILDGEEISQADLKALK